MVLLTDDRSPQGLSDLVPQWLGHWIRDREVASSPLGRSATK